MVLDDALGQRQSQTGPARVSGPALLEAGEAGEHLLAVLRGDAVAVVGDGQHDPRPLLPDGDHHTAATVAGGVVEQVAHHAGQLVAVAPHPAGRHPRQVERHVAHPGALRHDQLVDVDVGARTEAALLQSGHGEQVADQVIEAVVLGEHGPRHRRPVDVVGVAQGRLDLGADRRHRGAQLVAGVGDELALLDRRLLQPVEHVVHGDRQQCDLVLGRRHRDPGVEVRARQLAHPTGHDPDRRQGLSGDDPGHRAGSEHQQRQTDPQRGAQRVHRPVDLGQR